MEYDDDRQTGAIGKANDRWNEIHSSYERDKIKYDDWLELFQTAIENGNASGAGRNACPVF